MATPFDLAQGVNSRGEHLTSLCENSEPSSPELSRGRVGRNLDRGRKFRSLRQLQQFGLWCRDSPAIRWTQRQAAGNSVPLSGSTMKSIAGEVPRRCLAVQRQASGLDREQAVNRNVFLGLVFQYPPVLFAISSARNLESCEKLKVRSRIAEANSESECKSLPKPIM
jgi:hypothetical protein